MMKIVSSFAPCTKLFVLRAWRHHIAMFIPWFAAYAHGQYVRAWAMIIVFARGGEGGGGWIKHDKSRVEQI